MPTLKAEEFCEAFYIWAEACQTELPGDDEGMNQWRKEFAEHWSFIELAIHKSCLLDRLSGGAVDRISKRSMITVTSDGKLVINFGQLNETLATTQLRDQLKQRMEEIGFSIPSDYQELWFSISPENWMPLADKFVKSVHALGREETE